MSKYVKLSTLNVGDWVQYLEAGEIYEVMGKPFLRQITSDGIAIGLDFKYEGYDEVQRFKVVRTATPLKIEDFV